MKSKYISSVLIVLIAAVLFVDALTTLPRDYGDGWFGNSPSAALRKIPDSNSILSETMKSSPRFRNLNGLISRYSGKKNFDRIFSLPDDNLVKSNSYSDVKEQAELVSSLNRWLEKRNISFIYANLPSKNEAEGLSAYGVESGCAKNADRLLEALNRKGVKTVDVRKIFTDKEMSSLSLFYRTDHHWKTDSGLRCARCLLEQLNRECSLGLDTGELNEDRLERKLYRNCWTGEMGQKIGVSYSGKDDFELIRPRKKGRYRLVVPDRGIDETGDFSVMLDEDRLKTRQDYGLSFHYAYLNANNPLQEIDNLDSTKKGRVLLIKDSFAMTVAPFMAMCADRIVCWDLRYNYDSLKKYIEDNDIQAVVMAYSESQIPMKEYYEFR